MLRSADKSENDGQTSLLWCLDSGRHLRVVNWGSLGPSDFSDAKVVSAGGCNNSTLRASTSVGSARDQRTLRKLSRSRAGHGIVGICHVRINQLVVWRTHGW